MTIDNIGLLFFWACSKGYCKLIKELIMMGINVDSLSDFGETYLTFSIKMGNISAIRALLAFGSDVNLCNSYGENPLQCALYSEEIFTLLIKHGADFCQTRMDIQTLSEIMLNDNKYALEQVVEHYSTTWNNNALKRLVYASVRSGSVRITRYLVEKVDSDRVVDQDFHKSLTTLGQWGCYKLLVDKQICAILEESRDIYENYLTCL